jgi:hypothetical protein
MAEDWLDLAVSVGMYVGIEQLNMEVGGMPAVAGVVDTDGKMIGMPEVEEVIGLGYVEEAAE